MQSYSQTLLSSFQKYYLLTKDNNFYPDQYEQINNCELAIKELRHLNILENTDYIDGSISFTDKYLEKL